MPTQHISDDMDIVLSKFDHPITLGSSSSALATYFYGMTKILTLCDVFKVLSSIVCLYSVSVIDFKSLWAWAKKRIGYELMHQPVFPTIASTQEYPVIAGPIYLSSNLSATNSSIEALLNTFADARVLDDSSQSTNESVRANFVTSLVTNNRAPFPIHARHYITGGI